jgi:hypothetical protein
MCTVVLVKQVGSVPVGRLLAEQNAFLLFAIYIYLYIYIHIYIHTYIHMHIYL